MEVSPELLEFDPEKLEDLSQFEYIIIAPKYPTYNNLDLPAKIVKLPTNSKFYGRLSGFVCIGKYYFEDQSKNHYIHQSDVGNDDDFM